MNKKRLKEMIENEMRINPEFRKGRIHTLALALIYIIVRFSDPIISPHLASVPLELNFQLIFGLFVALYLGKMALGGYVKLTAVLWLLTPLGNMGILIFSAGTYAGGFAEMISLRPITWYILIASVICSSISVWLLMDKSIATFGKRRKEIQAEYKTLQGGWGTVPPTAVSEQQKETIDSDVDVVVRESEIELEKCDLEEVYLKKEN